MLTSNNKVYVLVFISFATTLLFEMAYSLSMYWFRCSKSEKNRTRSSLWVFQQHYWFTAWWDYL